MTDFPFQKDTQGERETDGEEILALLEFVHCNTSVLFTVRGTAHMGLLSFTKTGTRVHTQ